MYGIELSRRAVRRRAQEAAEAVTEPFAWHHGDFVKTTPAPVSPLFLCLSVSPCLPRALLSPPPPQLDLPSAI